MLARVGDPFIAPDGSLIAPEYPEDYFPRVKEETKINPVTFRGKRRRNLNELPAQTNIMNAVGAVMMYTFFGVGDREIAQALKCTVQEIEEIRAHAAYCEYLELIGQKSYRRKVKMLHIALPRMLMVPLTRLHTSRVTVKLNQTVLRASIDIMDRSGFNPKAVAEKQVITQECASYSGIGRVRHRQSREY